jgi:hypothetical protein
VAKLINKCEKNFTTISNHLIYSTDLSFKAKGLLIYMISRPENWIFYETEIAKNSKDGLSSIRSGIKELITQGYIVRHRVRLKNGTLKGSEYWIYDTPINKPLVIDMMLEQKQKKVRKQKVKSTATKKAGKGIVDPFFDDCELPTREHTQYDTNRLFRDHVDSV